MPKTSGGTAKWAAGSFPARLKAGGHLQQGWAIEKYRGIMLASFGLRFRGSGILVTASVCGIVFLAGCQSVQPQHSESPIAPTSTASADPPTESGGAFEMNEPMTWPISMNGIGPIHLEDSYDEAHAVLSSLPAGPNIGCSALWYLNFASGSGLGTVFALDGDGRPASVRAVSVAADTYEPDKATGVTDRGVGIGSSLAAVIDAYPDAMREDNDAESGADYYHWVTDVVLTSEERQLIFVTDSYDPDTITRVTLRLGDSIGPGCE